MKKILFTYPSMLIGGSTTALLSLLNNMPEDEYEIDLQLFRNEGPLLDMIPSHVNLLPQAEMHTGKKGRALKLIKFVLGGFAVKSFAMGITGNQKRLFSRGVAGDFQAKILSRKNPKEYDYAIGFLGGWSDRYLAFSVNAKKKYAWLHSTFKNITTEPREELPWMQLVDKIVFVADATRDDFVKDLPEMADKAIVIENITDSSVIKRRGLDVDATDEAYQNFLASDAFKIITVCRLTFSIKGLDRIVSCAKALKKLGKHVLWYIIGDGRDEALLHQAIKDADVMDVVIPIGKRMNPYPFIAAADVMCMPSRVEGKPVTVTESLILGTPPVVTNYLSAKQQIQNGFDGIVVENSDDAIIPVLEQLIDEPCRVALMRQNMQGMEYGNRDDMKTIEALLFCDE